MWTRRSLTVVGCARSRKGGPLAKKWLRASLRFKRTRPIEPTCDSQEPGRNDLVTVPGGRPSANPAHGKPSPRETLPGRPLLTKLYNRARGGGYLETHPAVSACGLTGGRDTDPEGKLGDTLESDSTSAVSGAAPQRGLGGEPQLGAHEARVAVSPRPGEPATGREGCPRAPLLCRALCCVSDVF